MKPMLFYSIMRKIANLKKPMVVTASGPIFENVYLKTIMTFLEKNSIGAKKKLIFLVMCQQNFYIFYARNSCYLFCGGQYATISSRMCEFEKLILVCVNKN